MNMNAQIKYPISKIFSVNGHVVKLVKQDSESAPQLKIYANGDEAKGMAIYKYLDEEGILTEEFLFDKSLD